MSKIKCIIIEDEPLAVKILTDYIAQTPFLQLQASFKDAIIASDYFRHNSTDLLFLDIHLPKLKGLSFLKTLPNPPSVIITTAYHQYAVEGFNLNVTDYLLKPIEFERFLAAVTKVRTGRVDMQKPADPPETRDFIFITVQKRKVKILFADIVYVESQREYIKIVTTRNEYVSKMSTHEIEALLPARYFRRVHRSFIVAIRRIESYTAEMIEMNGFSIPIGKGYRDTMENL
ncbi:MAG: response regulator transcription factor [Bacteroidota bacterium]|nr:response regulator transcription factor [Bacteroidota bacterium]MDP4254677.1 response regulator transcription factor [Bacteroidota bacterium]MDP4260264.1 response regulator transcription factor [Bacteroidota bacterium]